MSIESGRRLVLNAEYDVSYVFTEIGRIIDNAHSERRPIILRVPFFRVQSEPSLFDERKQESR